ncbi:MAG: hypothetical protein WC289_03370 [Patescibacteria group bacterium]|jgi:hypothetical protein
MTKLFQSGHHVVYGFTIALVGIGIAHYSIVLGEFIGNWVFALWGGLIAILIATTTWAFLQPKWHDHAVGAVLAFLVTLIPFVLIFSIVILRGDLM